MDEPLWIKNSDGTVTDPSGRIIFFSIARFITDICEGDCCFICGAARGDVEFNDEHVLPDWILRKHDLHSRWITLPNGTSYRYGDYKVACCKSCNSQMGAEIERPVQSLLSRSYDEIVKYLREHGPWLLVTWLYLIFLKTHLKDTTLRLNRDRRKSSEPISSLFDLEALHHVHCVARAFHSRCDIDATAFPSMQILPMKRGYGEDFDYKDMSHCMTMLLRTGSVGIAMALNDSGMAQMAASTILSQIAGSLTLIQLREVLAHLSFVNFKLLRRPFYRTKMDMRAETAAIVGVSVPSVELSEYDMSEYGFLLHDLVSDILDHMENDNIDEIRAGVLAGRQTFLIDDDGNFIERSMFEVHTDS